MERILLFKEDDWNAMRSYSLQEDQNERAVFCYVEANSDDPSRFYVRAIHLPDEEDYQIKTPAFNSLTPDAQIKLFNTFRRREEMGLLEIHSHPFAAHGVFSSIDDANFPEFCRDVTRRKEGSFMLRMVVGRDEDGFTCLFSLPDSHKEVPVTEIRVIGRNTVKKIRPVSNSSKFRLRLFPVNTKKTSTDNRFTRNVEWLGDVAQGKLSQITLGCIGAGGLMNPFILEAMHTGFKKFVIVDFDKIEEVNFNRLFGITSKDIGQYKVDVLKREMLKFDPDLDITVIKKKIQDDEVQDALQNTDILVSGVDNNESRLVTQIFAARHMIPMFDMGSGIYLDDDHTKIAAKGAQVRVFIPGYACLACQGLNVEEIHSDTWMEARKSAGYVMDTNESPGSVITFNAAIASVALSMLIDYITGINKIPLQVNYDELNYTMRGRNISSRSDCPICGEEGVLGAGMERTKLKGGQEEIPQAADTQETDDTNDSNENERGA